MSEHGLLRSVIVGGGGVGKSTLTIQHLRGMFVEDYDPTIEESYRKDVVIDGESLTIEILDTAGQEEYGAIRDRYLRTGDGFILVYSITSKPTFGEAKHFAERIRRAKDSEQIALVICGNKSDLEDRRVVTKDIGMQLAQKYNAPFYETSAKTGSNVEEVFTEAIREILRVKKFEDPSKKKKKKKKRKKRKNRHKRRKAGGDGHCTLL